MVEAPPRTRGWTTPTFAAAGGTCGSPAHAGMDPPPRRQPLTRPRLPRARGDGPHTRPLHAQSHPAPPRTRGWTRAKLGGWASKWGSPAHAGMDLQSFCTGSRTWWLPRARGDGPQALAAPSPAEEAPPRTRGWTQEAVPTPSPAPGSPAHAGMDPQRGPAEHVRLRLPRARGDGPAWPQLSSHLPRAPPRTRGWTCVAPAQLAPAAGSPAHAGMDLDYS